MYELALCAGVAGLSLGLQDAGIKTACYVERDDYRANVLIQRMRDGWIDQAPIWDDITTFDGQPWCGRVDIISAGFPCQPFSLSGERRGEDDKRNLWPDVVRIIRQVRPRYIVLENVPGLLKPNSHSGRPAPMAAVLADLAACRYDAEWQSLPACAFGFPHERERVFIVAYPNEGGRQAILRSLTSTGKEACTGWPSNHMDTPSDLIQRLEERYGEPAICGSDDGTAHRVERLEAIGEAVVRQVAAAIGRCIVKDWRDEHDPFSA